MADGWGLPGSQEAARSGQSCFDEFAPYVLKRWNEGERTGIRLYREIKEHGYRGSERTVYRYVEVLQQAEVKTPANLHRLHTFSATTAIWLFVRDPQTLDDIEQEDLAAICQVSTTLKQAYDLMQDFLKMVHQKEGERLDVWLQKISQSGIAELQSFAHGVEMDKEAVRVGLTSSINHGMVEGQVTK